MAPRTAPAIKQNPDELVQVNFIDTAGNRHEGANLPRRLLLNGTQRAKQNWLIQHGEIPDPSAPPLPDPVEAVIEEVQAEQVGAQQQQVEALRQQLDDIQSQLDGQPLSHAELVAARQEITGLMLKAADAGAQLVQVEGRGSQIKADLTALATPLQEQAAETARQQQENNEVTERVLGDLQEQAAATLTTLQQQGAAALADIEADAQSAAQTIARSEAAKVARAVAAQNYGAGTTICNEDPAEVDLQSFGERWFGRPLVSGDSALQTTKEGVIAHRFTGAGWVKSAELNPRVEIVSQPISILDQSTKLNAPITINKGGGGGGAGGEQLMVNRIRMAPGGSASYVLADSSNWAGVHDPLSGTLELEIRALDGTLSGRSGVIVAAFTWDGGTADKWVEYALIGDLQGVYEVNLSIQRGNAAVPPGSAGLGAVTIPLGSQALRVYATVQLVAGAGNPGATQFSVRGSVDWNFESAPRLLDPTQSAPQPLWVYA